MGKDNPYFKWLALLLLTGCIYLMLAYHLSADLDKKTADIKSRDLESLRNEVNTAVMMHEKLSVYFFNEKINLPLVLEPVSAASHSSDVLQTEQARQQLYHAIYSDYSVISHYGFRQMHFHLSDGSSFLRLHRPGFFGDNIAEVRKSIQEANVRQSCASGFEIGRIHCGYNFVYPLFYQGNLIGTMDMTISPETIQNILDTSFPHQYHEFLVKRDLVDSIVYESERSNYMMSLLSDAFYYDLEAYLANSKKWDESESHLILRIINGISQDPWLLENLKDMQDFAVEAKVDGENYLVSFAMIKCYDGTPAAYFVAYAPDQQLPAVRSAYYLTMVLLTLLYLIFGTVSWYFIRNRMKLETQAHIDPLTRIYNRYRFLELACLEVDKFRRYGRPMSIILFDLDFFKKVNDSYGHAMGDYVLKTVAQIINHNKRSSDLLARWGGEEFILLLPETALEEALAVAERLRISLADYQFDKCHQITASFGVAEIEHSDESLDTLIEKVDQALYKAKNNGRNRVEKHRAEEPYLFD